MENISQMSLIEVAVALMEQKRTIQNINSLIKESLEMKGLTDEDGKLTTRLYVDITTSSKFVYMGNDEWDLKVRQSLDQFDRDGSSFNSKDDEYAEEELDDENDIEEDLNEDDLEDEDDDDVSDDSEDDDDEDEVLDDESDVIITDDDDTEDVPEKFDEDFDEDKYNEYMDEYEDEYDN